MYTYLFIYLYIIIDLSMYNYIAEYRFIHISNYIFLLRWIQQRTLYTYHLFMYNTINYIFNYN